MYKGYMVYARGTSKEVRSEQIQDLIIVNELQWSRVQAIREKRNPNNKDGNQFVVKTTKGRLLFVGMIRCGHCGGTLTTTYNRKCYTLKDGTQRISNLPKYRCGNKAHNKVKCSGQTIYSQNKIEGVVLDEVFGYLNQLKTVDLTSQIEAIKSKNMEGEVKDLRKSKRQLDKAQSELSVLMDEVTSALMGKGKFKPELLSKLIDKKEQEVFELTEIAVQAENRLESKKVEYVQMKALQQNIPKWREVFEQASTEKKKMMLSTIIGGIIVRRDKIEIDFKIHISQFIDAMGYAKSKDNYSTNKVGIGEILSYSSLAANGTRP